MKMDPLFFLFLLFSSPPSLLPYKNSYKSLLRQYLQPGVLSRIVIHWSQLSLPHFSWEQTHPNTLTSSCGYEYPSSFGYYTTLHPVDFTDHRLVWICFLFPGFFGFALFFSQPDTLRPGLYPFSGMYQSTLRNISAPEILLETSQARTF